MDDKPKCTIDIDGTKRWILNGYYHREDGPAVEYYDGAKYWYINGLLHRKDGPAIEHYDGEKRWYKNGDLHRLDGPAVILDDGSHTWFINGYNVSTQIRKWAKENNIDLNNLTDVDKALIKIVWADYDGKY